MITILGSIVEIIRGAGEPLWPFTEHKNLHFDNEFTQALKIVRKVAMASIWIR